MDQVSTEVRPSARGSEARAHDLLGVGFVVGDGQRVTSANAAAARILGRSQAELLALGSIRSLLHPDDERRILATVADRTSRGQRIPERFSARFVRPDGSEVPVELWVKAEVVDGEVTTYTLIHEVGEQWSLREGLTQLALTDPLTQLANRIALEEHLRLALARLDRHPARGALFFMDLDGLKAINDRVGHRAGDSVLLAFATRLASVLRPSDTAARLGGDEFVALVPELDEGDPDDLVERFRQATTFSIVVEGQEVSVRASIGWTVFDGAEASAAELIGRADAHMYVEKDRRRTRS